MKCQAKGIIVQKFILNFKGTSNWTKDYFTQTAGLAFIFQSMKKTSPRKDLREKLNQIFLRDWNSQWSTPLM